MLVIGSNWATCLSSVLEWAARFWKLPRSHHFKTLQISHKHHRLPKLVSRLGQNQTIVLQSRPESDQYNKESKRSTKQRKQSSLRVPWRKPHECVGPHETLLTVLCCRWNLLLLFVYQKFSSVKCEINKMCSVSRRFVPSQSFCHRIVLSENRLVITNKMILGRNQMWCSGAALRPYSTLAICHTSVGSPCVSFVPWVNFSGICGPLFLCLLKLICCFW